MSFTGASYVNIPSNRLRRSNRSVVEPVKFTPTRKPVPPRTKPSTTQDSKSDTPTPPKSKSSSASKLRDANNCPCNRPHVANNGNQDRILCNECNTWFHRECISISKSAFHSKTKSSYKWFCPPCEIIKSLGKFDGLVKNFVLDSIRSHITSSLASAPVPTTGLANETTSSPVLPDKPSGNLRRSTRLHPSSSLSPLNPGPSKGFPTTPGIKPLTLTPEPSRLKTLALTPENQNSDSPLSPDPQSPPTVTRPKQSSVTDTQTSTDNSHSLSTEPPAVTRLLDPPFPGDPDTPSPNRIRSRIDDKNVVIIDCIDHPVLYKTRSAIL